MAQNFYNSVIEKSPFFNVRSVVNDLDLLEPNFRDKVEAVLAEAREAGQPLVVVETYRSPARQTLLHQQGRTPLKDVGVHHYGLAADLALDRGNGEPSWDGDLAIIGELAHKHDLVWGGDWEEMRDPSHVQAIAVEDQAHLFAGAWYPLTNA